MQNGWEEQKRRGEQSERQADTNKGQLALENTHQDTAKFAGNKKNTRATRQENRRERERLTYPDGKLRHVSLLIPIKGLSASTC